MLLLNAYASYVLTFFRNPFLHDLDSEKCARRIVGNAPRQRGGPTLKTGRTCQVGSKKSLSGFDDWNRHAWLVLRFIGDFHFLHEPCAESCPNTPPY